MILYVSRTGNIRYILSKLHVESLEINEGLRINTPYLLMTYTDGFGEVPLKVAQFLSQNASLCKGVVVSGNSNFGPTAFGRAGDIIASTYQVPLVCKLDVRGNQKNYETIQQFYDQTFSSLHETATHK